MKFQVLALLLLGVSAYIGHSTEAAQQTRSVSPMHATPMSYCASQTVSRND